MVQRTFNEELQVAHGVFVGFPGNYECGRCHVAGVKLWREYSTFQLYLRCARCACLVQGMPFDVDDAGTRPGRWESGFDTPRTDQIGYYVPAVPDLDDSGYWGYTSCPAEHYNAWVALPTQRPWPSNEDLDDLTERWHQGAWPNIELEQVIRDATGWDEAQYGEWVRSGRMS